MTAITILFALSLCIPADSAERKISGQRILEQVNALCDPSLKGRMALNGGGHRAAAMIAAAFEEAGLAAGVPASGGAEAAYEFPLTVVLDVLDKDINPDGDDFVYEMNPAGLTEALCPAVMARIDGRKEDVKDEVVLVIARYDGPGRDGARKVYPGADRNAAGVSVLLEAARALAARRGGVYRSVVFVALPAGEHGVYMRPATEDAIFERIDNWVLKYLVTSGEWDTFLESELVRLPGLAGAESWIAEKPLPLKKIHAVVDLNMVGREISVGREADSTSAEGRKVRRGLAVVGGETGEGLAKTVENACKGGSIDVAQLSYGELAERGIKRATESVLFVRKRIPSLWITSGPQKDHGTEEDSPERLDIAQLEETARLAYRLVKTLANEKESHPFSN